MNPNAKKVIAIGGALILLALAVYGNYLPYRKSKLYIEGTRKAQAVNTLVEFQIALDPSLRAASPIGQNELTRNLGSMILSIVRNAAQNRELVDAALAYLNSYYRPILEYGKGPSFNQDLYILGLIYESAYIRTSDPQHLAASKQFYEEAYRRGPKRPQVLYGLFDVYRFENNKAAAEKTFNEIILYWPDDENIKSQYQRFLDRLNG